MEARYKSVWYSVSENKLHNESLGISQYEGHTEFSKYFMQCAGDTIEECENKIKMGIDMMKYYESSALIKEDKS